MVCEQDLECAGYTVQLGVDKGRPTESSHELATFQSRAIHVVILDCEYTAVASRSSMNTVRVCVCVCVCVRVGLTAKAA